MTVEFYEDVDFLNLFIKSFEEYGFFGDCHTETLSSMSCSFPNEWYEYSEKIEKGIIRLGYDIPTLMTSWTQSMGYYITSSDIWEKHRSLLEKNIKKACEKTGYPYYNI